MLEIDELEPVLLGESPGDRRRQDDALGDQQLAEAGLGLLLLRERGQELCLCQLAATDEQLAEQRAGKGGGSTHLVSAAWRPSLIAAVGDGTGARRAWRNTGCAVGRTAFRRTLYGLYCWSIERTASTSTVIQMPLSSGSNNSMRLVPCTICASSETEIEVAPSCAGSPPLVRTVTWASSATT